MGCFGLMCIRPIAFISKLLNPCYLNRLTCPEWTYRYEDDTKQEIKVYNNWFCSELTAAALMYGGVIPPAHTAAWYTPHRVVRAISGAVSDGTVAQQRNPPPVRFTVLSDSDLSDDDVLLVPARQTMDSRSPN